MKSVLSQEAKKILADEGMKQKSKKPDYEHNTTKTDYIKNPKPDGYRSLHHIITVPVFLSTKVEIVNVEIQIRTIAMDFWASLEHELAYKLSNRKKDSVLNELKACADEIAGIDKRMQNLYNLSIDKEPDSLK